MVELVLIFAISGPVSSSQRRAISDVGPGEEFGEQQTFGRNGLGRWLWRKYRDTHGLIECFSDDRVADQYKLWNGPLTAAWKQ